MRPIELSGLPVSRNPRPDKSRSGHADRLQLIGRPFDYERHLALGRAFSTAVEPSPSRSGISMTRSWKVRDFARCASLGADRPCGEWPSTISLAQGRVTGLLVEVRFRARASRSRRLLYMAPGRSQPGFRHEFVSQIRTWFRDSDAAALEDMRGGLAAMIFQEPDVWRWIRFIQSAIRCPIT